MKTTIPLSLAGMFLYLLMVAASPSPAAPVLDSSYGNIPLAFTENEGQAHSSIRFTARGSGCGIAFSPSGTTFLLSRETAASVSRRAAKRSVLYQGDPTDQSDIETESFALGLEFVGANENPEIVGEDRLSWNNNYFIGNDPAQWRTDVPNYRRIRFREVYDGIDLAYYGNRKRVKYDFVVKPGEDPNKILLKYDFGEAGGSLAVNEQGELVVKTPVGELIEEKPYCYQKIGGKEVAVQVEYEVVGSGTYRFRVGKYDGEYDLVIDPELVFSTYLGGLPDDYTADVIIDSEGYVCVTGKTDFFSASGAEKFPMTPGAYDTEYNGGASDVFVTKLNRDGSQIIFSTLIGGSNSDEPTSIVLDSENNVVIAGKTISDDFPKAGNAYTDKERLRGFVTKLNRNGSQLVFSSLFSGSCDAMAVDKSGDLYITGQPTAFFITTPGAYDQKQDFVDWNLLYARKLSSNGSILIYSTYIEACYPACIACDDYGNAYIGGYTYYSDFPATFDAYDTSYGGAFKSDGIIAELNYDGSNLIYATFWGGSGDDDISDIEVDREGNIIFCGTTQSTDFPITENAPYPEIGGTENIFLSRFEPSGKTLLLSTYFGNGQTRMPSIALDAKQHIFMTGWAFSSYSIPTTNDAFRLQLGYAEGFLSIFDYDGRLFYATCWGGNNNDYCRAIAANERGDIVIAGETESKNFPISANAVDDSLQWLSYEWPVVRSTDVFVSVFSIEDLLPVEEDTAFPKPFALYQPYPNPFNSTTSIAYSLSRPDYVTLNVYTITGQIVESLYSGYQKGGKYNVTWKADYYSSGLYVIVLKTKHGKVSRKVSLLK